MSPVRCIMMFGASVWEVWVASPLNVKSGDISVMGCCCFCVFRAELILEGCQHGVC